MTANQILTLAEMEGYDTNEHELARFLCDGALFAHSFNDERNEE